MIRRFGCWRLQRIWTTDTFQQEDRNLEIDQFVRKLRLEVSVTQPYQCSPFLRKTNNSPIPVLLRNLFTQRRRQ